MHGFDNESDAFDQCTTSIEQLEEQKRKREQLIADLEYNIPRGKGRPRNKPYPENNPIMEPDEFSQNVRKLCTLIPTMHKKKEKPPKHAFNKIEVSLLFHIDETESNDNGLTNTGNVNKILKNLLMYYLKTHHII